MSRLAKSVWGPACWTFLHAAAAACQDGSAFLELLEIVQRNLPCPECKAHMAAYLKLHPPRFEETRAAESASLYVFDLHNHVNHSLGKEPANASVLQKHYDVALALRRSRAPPPFRRF